MSKSKSALALVGLAGVATVAFLFGSKEAKAAEIEEVTGEEQDRLYPLYLASIYYPQWFTHGELIALADILETNGKQYEADQVRDMAAYQYGAQPPSDGAGRFSEYLQTGDPSLLPEVSAEDLEGLTGAPTSQLDEIMPPPPGGWIEPPTPEELQQPQYSSQSPGVWPEQWPSGPPESVQPPPGYVGPPIEQYIPELTDNPFIPEGGLPPVFHWPLEPSEPTDLSQIPFPPMQ